MIEIINCRFFDSVGDSSSGQGTKWSGGGRWVSKSSGAGIRSGPRDNLNRVQMGVSNTMCDDAKVMEFQFTHIFICTGPNF